MISHHGYINVTPKMYKVFDLS